MKLDINAPLDAHALGLGRAMIVELRDHYPLETGQAIKRIPLHWSVEAYGCIDGHYNGVVDLAAGEWALSIATDPLLNATDPPQEGSAAHTAAANGNAFGIAVDGAVDATPSDPGPAPVQDHELECLCAFAAAVAIVYDVDVVGIDPTYNIHNVATHAEYAILMHYFPGDETISPDKWGESGPPYRWDLSDGTKSGAALWGNILRRRTHDYKVELLKGAA